MDNESREEWARDTGRAEGRAEGEKAEREKWLGVVSEKDTALAEQTLLIAKLRARLGEDK
jgi:hypothetical protein